MTYSVLLLSICLTIVFRVSHGYFIPTNMIHGRYRSRLSMSSSVGGRASSQPAPKKTLIISPTSTAGETPLLIIENFSQIQSGEKKTIGVIGTKNPSESHQQMIELLAYALVLSGNHIYTSGGGRGTNISVIRGALRACNPDLLTVILPQSLHLQPAEMQGLLSRVPNLIELPENDNLDLKDAANICNEKIILNCDKMVVFAYHTSSSILEPIKLYEETMEITKFFLD